MPESMFDDDHLLGSTQNPKIHFENQAIFEDTTGGTSDQMHNRPFIEDEYENDFEEPRVDEVQQEC